MKIFPLSTMTMKKKTSTKGLIKVFKKSLMKKFSLSPSEIKKFQGFEYILIIKSFTDKCIRLTLYPLENKQVCKLIVKDSNLNDDLFHKLSEYLNQCYVIHAPGLIEHNEEFIFECYLKLDIDSPEKNKLENFMNNIKKSSTFFYIKKIKFKN